MRTAIVLGLVLTSPALAADHAEAPGAAADPAADIADFYAWHDGDDVNAILTFAGLTAAGGSATYDADVLYGIHIDHDADNEADIDIWIRFGQDGDGNWGVQVANLPGTMSNVEGAVGEALEVEGQQVQVGLFDDPFFFDLAGYTDTLATGTLMFDATRDSLAGTNVTAIALTMDADAAANGGDTLALWATTARK